jgi:hypothetical protein
VRTFGRCLGVFLRAAAAAGPGRLSFVLLVVLFLCANKK